MKMKFGALVTDGRGKIGGHVASKNRYGAYLRTKVTPVNPASSYQVNARQRLGSLSQAWRALDADERQAWNSAVADYAKTDIFGDLRNPSGFNLFQRLNNNLLNCSEVQIDTPPLPSAVTGVATLTIAAGNGAQTLILTYTPVLAATHKWLVFATPALSPGKSFVKSEFRQIDVMANGDVTPFDISTEYLAKFGTIGEAGQKIFVQIVPILLASGQAGLPYQASCIILA